MSIGIGIVGCGMIANFHARAINDAEGAHLVACTDFRAEAATAFAEKNGCRAYASLEEMLAGSKPEAILITHDHPDHIDALDAMRSRLQVPVMAHLKSADRPGGINPDRRLSDEECIQVGECRLAVYHTPGHTPDQICFGIEGDHRIVVGDTIFKGGPGKTWSAQDFQTTLVTLRETVLGWPDETFCYPGHGLAFQLGEQRTAIEKFLEKDHGSFFGDATWDMAHME